MAYSEIKSTKRLIEKYKLTFSIPGVLISILFAFLFLFPVTGQSQQWQELTYKLTQSNESYQFWTTPPSERVF